MLYKKLIIITLIPILLFPQNNKSLDFKKINSKVSFSKEITYPKINKIKQKNINPSVISNKTVYLTFDDGPSYLTDYILDVLKEENIPATFFVTSHEIDKYKNTLKRMNEENHTIALHTATHNYSYIYSSIENYFNDLYKIKNEVFKITGIKSRIVRLPGGSSNTISKKYSEKIVTNITNILTKKEYYYFDWNIDSLDASGNLTKDQITNNVINNLKDGSNIVLMHDLSTKQTTYEALKDIIKYAKENGYTFAKITKKTKPIHHRIYN